MKRMPISAAKYIAEKYEKDQVIILCWDRKTRDTWVTTYGKSKSDCKEAAMGGEHLAKYLNLKLEKA